MSEKPAYVKQNIIPESCTKYYSEAQEALFLKRSWSNFDPQAYYLYGEDQNYETCFKDKGLQAAVDSWCKIQVLTSFKFLRDYRDCINLTYKLIMNAYFICKTISYKLSSTSVHLFPKSILEPFNNLFLGNIGIFSPKMDIFPSFSGLR